MFCLSLESEKYLEYEFDVLKIRYRGGFLCNKKHDNIKWKYFQF